MFSALHPFMLRTSVVLAILGFIVSLIASIFSGAGWLAILWRPFLYASLMAFMGAVIFFFLKKQVPEVIEEFEEHPEHTIEGTETVSASDLADTAVSSEEEGGNYYSGGDSGYAGEYDPKPSRGPRKGTAGPDEILVEGVRLKNQPEVMADAIKHLMDQDKE